MDGLRQVGIDPTGATNYHYFMAGSLHRMGHSDLMAGAMMAALLASGHTVEQLMEAFLAGTALLKSKKDNLITEVATTKKQSTQQYELEDHIYGDSPTMEPNYKSPSQNKVVRKSDYIVQQKNEVKIDDYFNHHNELNDDDEFV